MIKANKENKSYPKRLTHNFLSVMDATPPNHFPQQFKFHRRHQTPLGKHSPTFASFHCSSFTSHAEMKHRQAPSKIAHCNLFPTPRTTQEKQPGQSGYLNQRSQQLLLFLHSVPALFPLSIRPIMVGNKPYKKICPEKTGQISINIFCHNFMQLCQNIMQSIHQANCSRINSCISC